MMMMMMMMRREWWSQRVRQISPHHTHDRCVWVLLLLLLPCHEIRTHSHHDTPLSSLHVCPASHRLPRVCCVCDDDRHHHHHECCRVQVCVAVVVVVVVVVDVRVRVVVSQSVIVDGVVSMMMMT